MEDCFIAAQRGELQIRPSDFDLLLRSVDLLVRISEATKEGEPPLDQLSETVHNCVEQLKCLREGKSYSATASRQPQATVPPAPTEVSGCHNEPEASASDVTAVPSVTASVVSAVVANAGHPGTAGSERTFPSGSAKRSLVLECGRSLFQQDAEEMRKVLLRELSSDVEEVRVDLSKTVDIDPVGLAFLAAARLHVEKNSSAKLLFSPVSDNMQTVLRVAGVNQS
jgi:chemotaxis protein histidine kinase CheA